MKIKQSMQKLMSRESFFCNQNNQQGFSLIEVMVALGIFSVGLLGMMMLQMDGVRKTTSANIWTNSSIWASDQIEKILSLDYDNTDLLVTTPGNPHTSGSDLDGTSPDGLYTITWDVINGPIIVAGDPTSTYNTKTITITVSTTKAGVTRDMVLNYIKPNEG